MPMPTSPVPDAFHRLDADATALLHGWVAPDKVQERRRRRVLDHLSRGPGATWRGSGPAHITASVLVLESGGARALLAHHRKAHLWLQMGGHLEAGDTGVRAAAAREGAEESGIADLTLLPQLVDIDCHRLGSGFSRCAEHLDLRFAGVAATGAEPRTSAESEDVRWFDVEDLPADVGSDVPRLIAAAQRAVWSAPQDN